MLLIDKPDATQTYFQIGQPGIDNKNPDRTALEIINTLFGGRFTSMLNDALRVNSGLTYGARSKLEQYRLPGAIVISTYTKTDTTVQAIDMALDVLSKLNEKGITRGATCLGQGVRQGPLSHATFGNDGPTGVADRRDRALWSRSR